MSHPADTSAPRAGSAELREVLEGLLSERFGTRRRIARLNRRPWHYSTSFFIEELDVGFGDGERLSLMLKDVSRNALLSDARTFKPEFIHHPLREIEVYRSILVNAELETATCYGTVADEERDRFWIFLEQVPGERLNKIGEFEVWQQAAVWLARMHKRLAGRVAQGDGPRHLLRYDDAFYWRWLERALHFSSSESHPVLERIAAGYDPIVRHLLQLPVTIIHGDFSPSNVLVQQRPAGERRVCVLDWELSAVGPGLVDLATLTAGKWSEEQKGALARAYRAASAPDGALEPKAFESALDACRLQICIQWLGWSRPLARRHGAKWLAEVVPVAERVGL